MSSAGPLLPPLFLPLLLAPLLPALPAAAGFTNVSVTLTGPDEGWSTDNLQYSANPVCEVDAETRGKISNGEAILTTALYWNWGPTTLVTGGGPSDATATIPYDNCWAGY